MYTLALSNCKVWWLNLLFSEILSFYLLLIEILLFLLSVGLKFALPITDWVKEEFKGDGF